MVAFSRPAAVSPLVPVAGGAIAGLGTAALFGLLPGPVLEDWVWSSGLPALVAAAAPPLGTTARAVLVLAAGSMAGSVTWSLLYLLFGTGGLLAPRVSADAMPFVRRADAHRDAPPRRPMTAADLGTPLMEVAAPVRPPAVRPVPKDLDQPLAAFDPAAIPDEPRPAPERVASLFRVAEAVQPAEAVVPVTPVEAVEPLTPVEATQAPAGEPARASVVVAPPMPVLAPGERIDTFALTPPPSATSTVTRQPAARPSIEVLLRRLEEVTEQRMAMGR